MTLLCHWVPRAPDTPHLTGSIGRTGLSWADWVRPYLRPGLRIVVEPKLDGDSVGLVFDRDLNIRVLHHGALLERDPGPRFRSVLDWALLREDLLFAHLATERVLMGESLAWCHTLFYDAAPVFVEYDMWDLVQNTWESTPRRWARWGPTDVVSVPVLADMEVSSLHDLRYMEHQVDTWVQRTTAFRSPGWKRMFQDAARRTDPHRPVPPDGGEGLYCRLEWHGIVLARAKWIRQDFHGRLLTDGHWAQRPRLRQGA